MKRPTHRSGERHQKSDLTWPKTAPVHFRPLTADWSSQGFYFLTSRCMDRLRFAIAIVRRSREVADMYPACSIGSRAVADDFAIRALAVDPRISSLIWLRSCANAGAQKQSSDPSHLE
jgi:hypothetical protein